MKRIWNFALKIVKTTIHLLLVEVEDSGEVICEPCVDKAESIENYQCYVKNVTLKCGLTRRGW